MTETTPPVHLRLRGKIDEATERFANRAALTAAHLFGVTIGTHLRQLRSLTDPVAELQAQLEGAELKARLGWQAANLLAARPLSGPAHGFSRLRRPGPHGALPGARRLESLRSLDRTLSKGAGHQAAECASGV